MCQRLRFWVQLKKWRHSVKWRQNNTSIYRAFKRSFTGLQKLLKVSPCQNSLTHNIIQIWCKYIISLQNYLIKLTTHVLIKVKHRYIWHIHCLWCYRHVFQSGDININKRAQRALGRSPEEKVKGHSGDNNREP